MTWTRRGRDFAARLGIEHPIIQAPMAGPGSPELAAAVSNAGGLGSIAAAYLSPEQIAAQVAAVRGMTDRPFAVNLFAGGATDEDVGLAPITRLLARWHRELGIDPPAPPAKLGESFDAQMEAVRAADVPVFSFALGLPDPSIIADLKRRGTCVMGTATTVDEARALEAAGVDAIVTQGGEAGGHRSTFAGPPERALIGTLALVPQIVDAVSLPVVAAGGIMDGRGIVAALALGASAVQMGTAFIPTAESGATPSYRAALLAAREDEVVVTRAFSGRPARGLRNRWIAEVEDGGVPIPRFPLLNAMTRPLRNAAARADLPDAQSLWCGQGVRLARVGSAAELVARLVDEVEAVRRELGADGG
jgi:nitronate monooxygenase